MIWDFIKSLLSGFRSGGLTGEVPSPRVAISTSDISYDIAARRITIDNIEPDIWVTTVQGTNSMEPYLDEGHIIVLSNHPKYLDALNNGDVVVWEQHPIVRIHAIDFIGEDEQGWYCYTKGWNLPRRDAPKIRKDDIKWVGLMVFWLDEHDNHLYSRVYKEED